MAMLNSIDELMESVKNDRLITIIVGEDSSEEFKMQETLLRRTSRVFAAALNHEHLGEGDRGVLRFPKDDAVAWKVLISWIITHEVLLERHVENVSESQSVLADCWVIGDRYDIATFQDALMLEFLLSMEYHQLETENIIRMAYLTPPGSKIRLVAAQEIVELVYACCEKSKTLPRHWRSLVLL